MKRLMIIFALFFTVFALTACQTYDDTYNGRDTTYNGTEDTYNGEDDANGYDDDLYNGDADTNEDDDSYNGDADTSDDSDPYDGDDDTSDDDDSDEEDTLRVFTLEELEAYDGLDGSDAYIAVHNTVYDVTNSNHWMDGIHQGRYQAGQDLTEEIDNLSPHGRSVLDNVPIIGTLEDETESEPNNGGY